MNAAEVITEPREAWLLVTAMVLVNTASAVALVAVVLVSDPSFYRALALATVVLLAGAVACSEVASSRIVRKIGIDQVGLFPFQFLRPRFLQQSFRVVTGDGDPHNRMANGSFLFPLGVAIASLLSALLG